MMRCSVKPSSHARCSRHAPCAVGRGASSLRAITCVAALCLAAAFGSSELHAHDGPEHVIERINSEIEQSGPTKWLLYSRAMEYRALRNYGHAEADLASADQLEPGDWSVQMQWIQVLAKLGRHAEATRRAEALVRDLPKNANSGIHADVLALNGHVYAELGRWSDAAELFRQSVAMRPDVNYILMRSRALTHLPERRDEQLQSLRSSWESMQSPVILRELCDVLLRAEGNSAERELAEASEIIERELAVNRLRSAWLIRRAMLNQRRGQTTAVEADLQAALSELAPRIDPTVPDCELLVQRGLARAMLGDIALAQADLRRAEHRHAPDWILAPLMETIGNRSAPTVVSPDE